MEAGTTPPDPAAQQAAGTAAPPPPPPATGTSTDENAGGQAQGSQGEQQQQQQQTEQPAASKDRDYAIFTERKLDLSSAAQRKIEVEELAEIAKLTEGKLTILVKVGAAKAPDPRKAIMNLGEVRDLDGDYEVIAASARNKFPGVKATLERKVTIG